MKIGVYSDLHSNLPALECLIANKQCADLWLCAGDSIGLFPCVNEVLNLQRELNIPCVRGDHEALLLSGDEMKHSFTGNASLIKQREQITPQNLNYIEKLPESLDFLFDNCKVRLCHALSIVTNDVITKNVRDQTQIDELYKDYDLVLSGHTHLPCIVYGRNVISLNPGSLGFPIDTCGKPCAAVFDTDNRSVEFLRFEVDISRLKRIIEIENYNKSLITYLQNGFHWK